MAQASSHRSPQLRPRTAALHVCGNASCKASPPCDKGLHSSFDSSVQIIQENLAFAAAHGRCRLELVHPPVCAQPCHFARQDAMHDPDS